MLSALFTKRFFRLGLRRFYSVIGSSPEHEKPRNLHEVLEKPERRGCKRVLAAVLCVPIIFYFYLLMPPLPRVEVATTQAPVAEAKVDYAAIQNLYFNGPKFVPIRSPKEALLLLRKGHEKKTDTEVVTNYATQVIDIMENTPAPETTTTTPKHTSPECVFIYNETEQILNTSKLKVSLDEVYPMVKRGGHYTPSDCWTKHKVAVLVPYRNRTRNLTTFLYNIHPFLMNQKLEYRIFVIEQYGNMNEFNKGRLYNAGFKEMQKFGEWRCVVFHDVDLLPLSARVLYTCPFYPRHMSSAVVDAGSTRNTSSPILFGGVTIMSLEHYRKANGHSNLYWGWGGEDYDMFWRLRAAGMPVVRYNKTIAKYLALPHRRQRANPVRYRLLHRAVDRWQDEGLSSVKYSVISVAARHLFTHILVDVNPYKEFVNV